MSYDAKVKSSLSLFEQYMTEKRLEYAKQRRAALGRPAGLSDSENEDEDLDAYEVETCNRLSGIAKREEKRKREAENAGSQAKRNEPQPGTSSQRDDNRRPEEPTAMAPSRDDDDATNRRQPERLASVVVQPRSSEARRSSATGGEKERKQWHVMPCLACGDNGHGATKCEAFRKLRYLAKWAIVNASGACPNCVRLGHSANECGRINGQMYARGCPRCNGALHNSVMCDK